MKVINLNSKKVAVFLNKKILGELIEIENVVEKVGQYGNIIKYRLATENDKSVIYLDLQEDYKKFALLDMNTMQDDANKPHKIMDDSGNIVAVDPTKKQMANDGKTYVSVTNSNNEEVLVSEDKLKNLKPAVTD